MTVLVPVARPRNRPRADCHHSNCAVSCCFGPRESLNNLSEGAEVRIRFSLRLNDFASSGCGLSKAAVIAWRHVL